MLSGYDDVIHPDCDILYEVKSFPSKCKIECTQSDDDLLCESRFEDLKKLLEIVKHLC